jgi:hypothetical protein
MAPPLTLDRCRLPGWLRSCDDRTVTPPYAAELRVYEPLAAFDVEERRRWQQYAQSPAVPSAQAGARRERVLGLVGACRRVAAVPRPGDAGEHAAVLRGESGLLICPLRTELRCWEAAVETRSALPPEVARAVLPDVEVELASTEQQRWLVEHPTRRPHVQLHRWSVPVRWFVLFDREERRLQLGPAGTDSGRLGSFGGPFGGGSGGDAGGAPEGVAISRSLVYRTAMAKARRRVARALQVLRKALPDGPTVPSVEALGRWLEDFHPRSLVELDYLGLVDLCAEATLRTDDSAGDVAEALAALQRGDTKLASAAYDRVTDRWRIAYSVESSN